MGKGKGDFPRPHEIPKHLNYCAFKIDIGGGETVYGGMMPEVEMADTMEDSYNDVSAIVFEIPAAPAAELGSLIFYGQEPGKIAVKAKNSAKRLGNKYVSVMPLIIRGSEKPRVANLSKGAPASFGRPVQQKYAGAEESLWSDEDEESEGNADHEKLNIGSRLKDLAASTQGHGQFTGTDLELKEQILLKKDRFYEACRQVQAKGSKEANVEKIFQAILDKDPDQFASMARIWASKTSPSSWDWSMVYMKGNVEKKFSELETMANTIQMGPQFSAI